MIIVVEGISASGKTKWCSEHGGDHVIPEAGKVLDAPDCEKDPFAAAAFWSVRNAQRWQAALVAEAKTGLAICDTDPVKLHYDWCLWQIGEASEQQWRHALNFTRESLLAGRVGLADSYFVKEIDPPLARLQRDGDATRARRNFELHLRLQSPLIAWYEALGAALPGRVKFSLPTEWALPAGSGPKDGRYDVVAFDHAINLLPAVRAF